jgi:hypothetical protein
MVDTTFLPPPSSSGNLINCHVLNAYNQFSDKLLPQND